MSADRSNMLRNAFCLFVVSLVPFFCNAQATNHPVYKTRIERAIAELQKFPIEARLATDFSGSTNAVVDLTDTLTMEVMKSISQDTFNFLSKEKKTVQLFNDLLNLRRLAISGVKDLTLKSSIATRFSGIIVAETFDDWMTKIFKDKSKLDTLSKLREIQTTCLQIQDLVFVDLELRTKKE